MDNQHQKIKGYRELQQEEIDLMNDIKAVGLRIETLCLQVVEHLQRQVETADSSLLSAFRDSELARIEAAQPYYWASSARADLQTALMKLTRAVAQPTTF